MQTINSNIHCPMYPSPSVIIITYGTLRISLPVHVSLSFPKRCVSLHFFNLSLSLYNISVYNHHCHTACFHALYIY